MTTVPSHHPEALVEPTPVLRRHSRIGLFQVDILRAIDRLGGGASGLEILAELGREYGRSVNSGAVYGTLHRLEDRGYVNAREESSVGEADVRQRRRRVTYTVTDIAKPFLESAPPADLLGWQATMGERKIASAS